MYLFSVRHFKVIIVHVAFISVIVHGLKFLAYETGFNPNLNLFELHSAQCRNKITCGALCEMKECSSFIYEDLTKQCTLFSVFMRDDNAKAIGRYYAKSDALEFKVKDNTCSNVSFTSPGPNIALQKSVTLSSSYTNHPLAHESTPKKLVDGSRNGIYPNCAHTNWELNPYAIVDLSKAYPISAMYIVNRADCCADRSHDFVIQIGDDLAALTTVFNHSASIGDDCTVVFDTAHEGRYIRLLIEAYEPLAICELEVYITK